MKKYKVIIFDLDGVLINSKINMNLAWNKVRKVTQVKKTFNEYFKFIGLPFNEILKKLKIKDIHHEKIEKTFSKHSIKKLKKIKLYKKVNYVLRILKKKKIQMCIVTSKDGKRTKEIIRHFNIPIKYSFSPSRNLRGKPHPDKINKALEILSSKKKDACYVGDMFVDYKTAKNAKIDFIYADYGYGKLKKNFDIILKKPEDIIKYI